MSINQPKASVQKIKEDARGQFARQESGGKSDGVASAKPTVITGSEDATAHKWPPGTDNPPPDWQINFDEREQTNRR
ncbi:hypothetical protein FB480_10846 [Agrobacterium vitis]|nr:hypothetical protein FB480_10846 [Agrobacterium vitis]